MGLGFGCRVVSGSGFGDYSTCCQGDVEVFEDVIPASVLTMWGLGF